MLKRPIKNILDLGKIWASSRSPRVRIECLGDDVTLFLGVLVSPTMGVIGRVKLLGR